MATSANLGPFLRRGGNSLHQQRAQQPPSHLEHLLLPRYEALAGLCGAAWEQHDFYPG